MNNFYKVLLKNKDGTLRSALRKNPCSIIYEKITHAPQNTGLFVFSDLDSARDFALSDSLNSYVIYRVNVTNPRKPAHIITPFYLDEVDEMDIIEFWKGNWKDNFSFVVLTFPMNFTYICDSVELLEEIN